MTANIETKQQIWKHNNKFKSITEKSTSFWKLVESGELEEVYMMNLSQNQTNDGACCYQESLYDIILDTTSTV